MVGAGGEDRAVFLSPPLRGRVGVGGKPQALRLTTPTPDPSPQGEGEGCIGGYR